MKNNKRIYLGVVANILFDIVIIMLINRYWAGDNHDFKYLYTQSTITLQKRRFM